MTQGICLLMTVHGGRGSADVTRIRAVRCRGDNSSHAWVFSVTESQRPRRAGLCLKCEEHAYDVGHSPLSWAFLSPAAAVLVIPGAATADSGSRHEPRISGKWWQCPGVVGGDTGSPMVTAGNTVLARRSSGS